MSKYMDEDEALGYYDALLDDVYPAVTVAGQTWEASAVLREMDPTAYRTGFTDYLDSQNLTITEDEATECNECDGELPEHEDDCSRNDEDEDEDEDGEVRFSHYPGQIFLTPEGFVGNIEG